MSHTIPFSNDEFRNPDDERPFIRMDVEFEKGPPHPLNSCLVDSGSSLILLNRDIISGWNIKTQKKPPKGIASTHYRWRGQQYEMLFARVKLTIKAMEADLAWDAFVGLWENDVDYAILGQAYGLRLFDYTVNPIEQELHLHPNARYKGTA